MEATPPFLGFANKVILTNKLFLPRFREIEAALLVLDGKPLRDSMTLGQLILNWLFNGILLKISYSHLNKWLPGLTRRFGGLECVGMNGRLPFIIVLVMGGAVRYALESKLS